MTDEGKPRRRTVGPESLASAAIDSPRRPVPAAAFDPVPEKAGPSTRAVQGGRRPERNAGAVVVPIYQTSTFHYPEAYSEAGASGTRIYTRYDNPTQEAAAEVIRLLEGAGAARVFASGMSAISTTLLTFARSGDSITASEELYGGSSELLRDLLPTLGVRVRWVPAGVQDPSPYVDRTTKVVYVESPTNPLLRVYDLRSWARAADARGALLVVDNTFATPVNQRPLELGADLVVHSASKYLGGHSDLIAGAVAGAEPLLRRIVPSARVLGGSLDPLGAFLLLRGLRTLPLRIARQNENGRAIAERLERHPAVRKVHYPGLGEPEQEAIAARQMTGRSGVVAFSLTGGARAVDAFLRRLRHVHVAASLGGVESLISAPGQTSHAALSEAERTRLGIDPGLLRFSSGIEDVDDIWDDIRQALETP